MGITRREILKKGAAVAVSSALPHQAVEERTLAERPSPLGSDINLTTPQRLLLDFNWRFHLGHAADPELDFGFGAPATESTFAKADRMIAVADTSFDDTSWPIVRLPHDWAVDLPFIRGKDMAPHGSKPIGRGYPETSVGWYRRRFRLPAEDAEHSLSIEFDGIFRDAMIFLNGHFLGRNASGYAPYRVDITDYANYGGDNALTVRVDATLGEGWFYEGAGIYRHVWLDRRSRLHLVPDGVFVTTAYDPGVAALTISSEVQNNFEIAAVCRIRHQIFDADDREVLKLQTTASTVPAGELVRFEATGKLHAPRLWSLESPHRYRVATSLITSRDVVADTDTTRFGVRTAYFDAKEGFFLNGRPLKIKGTCNHQDHAGVGVALPDFLHRYRIERLRSFGSNACRTSHNPATPEFLDECDATGMLVVAEVRHMASTPEGLSQMERMVRRDRNRPSIILWSLGNEEPEQGSDRGARIVRSMKKRLRALDPTRMTTVAMNGNWGKGISKVVDVQGCNYNRGLIDEFHNSFPSQPMIGTETGSTFSTRGEYITDPRMGVVSAYDVNPPHYGDTAEQWWQFYEARPFLSGGFVWTGFDYRGEPNPDVAISVGSQFGILDTCGFPKDNYFYYKAWWTAEPTLHLFPHWNWREGETVQVWCFSNVDAVELLVNGISQGTKRVPHLGHTQWDVPFEPGMIEARGYQKGDLICVDRRTTVGEPAAIWMSSNGTKLRADGEDGCVVSVSVVDAVGALVPGASNEIAFEVSGPAELIGVGNGDPNSREADKATRRRVFHGLCCAIVQTNRTPGIIRLSATSPGLKDALLELHSVTAEGRDGGI